MDWVAKEDLSEQVTFKLKSKWDGGNKNTTIRENHYRKNNQSSAVTLKNGLASLNEQTSNYCNWESIKPAIIPGHEEYFNFPYCYMEGIRWDNCERLFSTKKIQNFMIKMVLFIPNELFMKHWIFQFLL